MPTADAKLRYGAVAQALHWLIAALIVVQFVLAKMAIGLPLGLHKLILLARHKSFGMTILVLAVLRLAWRLFNKPPALPAAMSRFDRGVARTTHAALYALLFAMPLTGWMMSSAKNYSVSWFNLFTWPNLIGPSDAAFKLLRSTHHLLSKLLLAVVVLHILAALKHHFWNKDGVLLRMLPFIHARTRR
ncbi:MAG TPA: cytochrome b [Steroidobacteraceae bacterium]|nr:cytochrome b [Steroidobacteraceae bacterium]